MKEVDFLASEITRRYGTVQRARGCFLYTRTGVRLTDLYQEGGRAILGWGGGSAFTVFKNVMNRGLTGSFDTDYDSRIAKAVSELLASDRKVGVYPDKQAAVHAAVAAFPQSTSFWKPWNQQQIEWQTVDAVIIEPPLPWAQSLFLVALQPSSEADAALDGSEKFRIPAPLAAAVVRSVYDMIAALQNRKESDWFIYDTVVTKYWIRTGPYLVPKIPERNYTAFLQHCLDCGLVISPLYERPSIVPFGADRGVFGKLKNSVFGG